MPANNSPSGSKMPFLNGEMLALNVMTVPIEQSIVTEFAALAGGAPDPTSFASVRPPWHSDIEWISARTETAFATFESAFERLDIAKWVEPYVDYDTQIRMFGGFVVLRSQCDEPSFHLDWHDGNNNGFNLLTPITDNGAGFGLIYKKLDGSVGSYDIKWARPSSSAATSCTRRLPVGPSGRWLCCHSPLAPTSCSTGTPCPSRRQIRVRFIVGPTDYYAETIV